MIIMLILEDTPNMKHRLVLKLQNPAYNSNKKTSGISNSSLLNKLSDPLLAPLFGHTGNHLKNVIIKCSLLLASWES